MGSVPIKAMEKPFRMGLLIEKRVVIFFSGNMIFKVMISGSIVMQYAATWATALLPDNSLTKI